MLFHILQIAKCQPHTSITIQLYYNMETLEVALQLHDTIPPSLTCRCFDRISIRQRTVDVQAGLQFGKKTRAQLDIIRFVQTADDLISFFQEGNHAS